MQVRKFNWLRHFQCSNIVVYTENLVFPLQMNVSTLKAMIASNKHQNDCQKGQSILFGMFWVLFCTFWFCRCSTHYNGFWRLCGWNFKALNVFTVDSLENQSMGNIFAINLCKMAFSNLISSWCCGCRPVSQMTLHCHYMFMWSLMVFNKSRLPISLSEGQ